MKKLFLYTAILILSSCSGNNPAGQNSNDLPSKMALGENTAETIDLSRAVIIAPDSSIVVKTAQRMITEEIAKRTHIELANAKKPDNGNAPVILLCRIDKVPAQLREFVGTMNVPEKAEGFSIAITKRKNPTVVLAGRDVRGVLFAAGKLLLQMKMKKGLVELPKNYRIATVPRFPLRGHQIGYRALSHCYDAWTPEIYEQYMRELAIFGANAFETFFGRPDAKTGPLGKVTFGEMMEAWSRICTNYGFEFWIFDEALGGDGKSDEETESIIRNKLDMLRNIPHLNHLFLTGGDGATSHKRPDLMFDWTRRFALEAQKIHPGLGIWVSNQGFGPELNNSFFDYLQCRQPKWLTGVVYGAWSRIPAYEERVRTPAQYPIRRYPDIGHCVRSQYPVPGWDRAFARTLGREPFAPRPVWHARIHNLFDQYADGFITYSDGVGDDVNKFVWTALGWDPGRDLDDILLDYSRFFFGWDIAKKVREGLYGLEENFNGPLSENKSVEKTFALWKSLEENADETLLANWRFQECLLRAYYDQYTRLRLLKANDIEAGVYSVLRKAPSTGVEKAIARARKILKESDQDDETNMLRKRIMELGAELFESIGAQLDVAHYKALRPERGAILDFLDTPLNNKLWLENEFDAILTGRFTATMPKGDITEGDVKLVRLNRVINWENPGPGGFYDDLGCAWKQPHLIKPIPLWDDPAGVTTPREDHTFVSPDDQSRLSWLDIEEALNASPFMLHYEGLDPKASYRVCATYLGRYNATIRLVADREYEIHGAYGHTLQGVRYAAGYGNAAAVVKLKGNGPAPAVTPLEFVIPREATKDGVLDLSWQRLTGRGTQIAEVWLVRCKTEE